MPKLSIIIPVYNVEKYLRQCLDSLLVQTLDDIEIICVNDDSPDNCGSILDEYAKKDKRIRIINQQNSGSGPARNNGLDHAKGEYIGFVDSDDWVSSDYFEVLYNSARSNEADICATSSVAKAYEHTAQRKTKGVGFSGEKIVVTAEEKKSLVCRSGVVWNKIYKKTLVDTYRIRFASTKSTGEDNMFNIIAILTANKISCITRGTYFYRIRMDSAINSRSSKDLGVVEVYSDILSRAKELGFDDEKMNIIRKRTLRDFGNTYSKLDRKLRKEFLAKTSVQFPNEFNRSIRRFYLDMRWILFKK